MRLLGRRLTAEAEQVEDAQDGEEAERGQDESDYDGRGECGEEVLRIAWVGVLEMVEEEQERDWE